MNYTNDTFDKLMALINARGNGTLKDVDEEVLETAADVLRDSLENREGVNLHEKFYEYLGEGKVRRRNLEKPRGRGKAYPNWKINGVHPVWIAVLRYVDNQINYDVYLGEVQEFFDRPENQHYHPKAKEGCSRATANGYLKDLRERAEEHLATMKILYLLADKPTV